MFPTGFFHQILQEYNYNNIDHRSVVIEFTNDKESSKYLGDLFYSIEEINKRKNNNNINPGNFNKYTIATLNIFIGIFKFNLDKNIFNAMSFRLHF